MTVHWHDDVLELCPCDEGDECVHDHAKADDLECPECGADLAVLDDAPSSSADGTTTSPEQP